MGCDGIGTVRNRGDGDWGRGGVVGGFVGLARVLRQWAMEGVYGCVCV